MGFTRIRAADGRTTGKRITPQNTTESNAFPYLWTHWYREDWQDFEAAAAALREAAATGIDAYVPGVLKDGLNPLKGHRRLRLDSVRTGDHATIDPILQTWVAIDVDDLEVTDGEEHDMLREAVDEHLPHLFHETGFVYQWTSGYKVKGPRNRLRVRLFFQLEEPATLAQIRHVLKSAGPAIDRSIYQYQAVMYVADPVLAEGVEDPCPQRVGIVEREYDLIPPLPEVAEEEAAEPIATAIDLPTAPPTADEVKELEAAHDAMVAAGVGRHNAGLSLTCELLGRGMPADQVVALGEAWMFDHGRDPQPSEVMNWVGYWEDHQPPLRLTTAAQAFAEEPEQGSEQPQTERPVVVWDEDVPASTALSWLDVHYPPVVGRVRRVVRVWGTDYSWEPNGWAQHDDSWLASRIVATNESCPVKLWRQMAQHIRAVTYVERGEVFEVPFYLDGRPNNNDTLILNNGVLRLRRGKPPEFGPHDPMLFSPGRAEYNFDPKAQAPRWTHFLQEVFPEQTLDILELQKVFGLLMERSAKRQKFVMMVGKSGSGKGTIGRVMSRLVGRGATVAPSLPDLGTEFGKQSLIGKRLALVNESTDVGRSNGISGIVLDELKKLTGHDMVQANRKNQTHLQFVFEGKVVIAANTLPSFSESSDAIVRRMVPFRFRVQVDDDKRDERLDDILAAEMPGILNWAIEGWQRLQQEGFRVTPSQREELKNLKDLTDPLQGFCNECLEEGGEDDRLSTDDAYHVYGIYAGNTGRRSLGKPKWSRQLADRLGKRVYPRVGMTPEFIKRVRLTTFGESLREQPAPTTKGF